MTSEVLVALLDGQEVGRVTRERQGRLAFTYAEEWRISNNAYPLSLSVPLAAREHKHEPIEAFLWGLLPDNEYVLGKWAQRFQVSARNAFGLIANVGEDCAGAVQFVLPGRLDELQTQRGLRVEWLDETAVARRLRALRQDHSAWRAPGDAGQFSLAGAQPKTALLLDGKRWGVPSGRTPTTHILKPPSGDFDGHAENEHFCLALARAVGLPAASSEVRRFDGEVAIVIERYDRLRTSTLADAASGKPAARLKALAKTQPVLRLHQEDICQALAVLPIAKYQNDGGPTPAQIVELLRTHSSRPTEDAETFIDALAFNWLSGGTDGHAKNYSLLLGVGAVRLAPLYDLASVLPYKEFDVQRLKLAMKIGGTYRLRDIVRSNWEKCAKEVGLPPDAIVGRVVDLAARVRKQVELVQAQIAKDGLMHPVIERLAVVLEGRARKCLRSLRA